MQVDKKVIVVGTTPPYIEWIRKTCPGRAIFLTDILSSSIPVQKRKTAEDEITCDLSDYKTAHIQVQEFLYSREFELDGIACFDCESMELTASLAEHYELPYPSIEAVQSCRDKYSSKKILHEAGVSSPKVRKISSYDEAIDFFEEVEGPCVLKPLHGSGSELVFSCETAADFKKTYPLIVEELSYRKNNRLFNPIHTEESQVVCEEKIEGIEFSCDFLIEDDLVRILRISQKIISPVGPFGTIRGYTLSAEQPKGVDHACLIQILLNSARALGIVRSICMIDFIIKDDEIVVLEITPRPGGDCLPHLLLKSGNMDILKLTLDFAQKRPVWFLNYHYFKNYIGLRLLAENEGILKRIHSERLRKDKRVRSVHVIKKPGHIVKLPPVDYDSWILGHVIIQPFMDIDFDSQCSELIDQLTVEIECR